MLTLVFGCSDSGSKANTGKEALSGKVTLNDQPLKYVIINATGAGGIISGSTTNEAGEYLIPDPPKGMIKFTVMGSKPGAKLAPNAPSVVPDKYSKPNDLQFDYQGGKQTFDLKLVQ